MDQNPSRRDTITIHYSFFCIHFNTGRLNVAATLDLSYNGSVLARSGTGYLLTFDGLVNTGTDSKLCFRPLKPALTTAMYVVWRKHQQFTKAGELFLNEIRAKL